MMKSKKSYRTRSTARFEAAELSAPPHSGPRRPDAPKRRVAPRRSSLSSLVVPFWPVARFETGRQFAPLFCRNKNPWRRVRLIHEGFPHSLECI